MQRLKLALVLAWAVLGAPFAFANETQYAALDGTVFDFEENEHGGVLTATDPANSPIVTRDDTARAVSAGQKLYLGRACEAYSQRFGNGEWHATDGGFFIDFPRLRVAFPGQRLALGGADDCLE